MRSLLIALVFIFSTQLFSQSFEMSSLISEKSKTGTVEGIIFDGDTTDAPLIFADVIVKDTNISTTTEIDGTFNFNLKPGVYSIKISFLGYKTIEIENVKVESDKVFKINSTLNSLQLEPVLTASVSVFQN